MSTSIIALGPLGSRKAGKVSKLSNYDSTLLTTVELADKAGILNLGLRDQLTAMEWVNKNIGVFGGDKNKVRGSAMLLVASYRRRLIQVTAFGESAGSIMTSILYLNSPLETLVRGTVRLPHFPFTLVSKPQIRQHETDLGIGLSCLFRPL